MKKYTLITIALFLVSGFAMAGSNVRVDSQQFTDNKMDPIAEVFAPRQFCEKTGGDVSETENKNIYLCCYETKQKCIATDIYEGKSWITPCGLWMKKQYASGKP